MVSSAAPPPTSPFSPLEGGAPRQRAYDEQRACGAGTGRAQALLRMAQGMFLCMVDKQARSKAAQRPVFWPGPQLGNRSQTASQQPAYPPTS